MWGGGGVGKIQKLARNGAISRVVNINYLSISHEVKTFDHAWGRIGVTS